MKFEKYQRLINNLEKNSRYLIMRSLNDATFHTNKQFREKELGKDITLRNSYTKRNIRYEKASRSKLQTKIGSKNHYIKLLVDGDTHTTKYSKLKIMGSVWLAVPMRNNMRTKTGKIKAAYKISRLLQAGDVVGGNIGKKKKSKGRKKRRAFVQKIRGKLFIVRRFPGKKNKKLEYLYSLQKRTKYSNQLKWEKRMNKTFGKNYAKAYAINLKKVFVDIK